MGKRILGWALIILPCVLALTATVYFFGQAPAIAAIISVLCVAVPFAMIGYGAYLLVDDGRE